MSRQDRRERSRELTRRGTTLVEMAVVLPVFFLFLFAIFEFSHAYFAVNMLNAAAKRGARLGVSEGVTTAEVEARVREILESGFGARANSISIQIKDASIFDAGGSPGPINYGSLPNVELKNATTRQLFVVRVEVPYQVVSIVPPFYAKDITLSGQSVMRHE